MNTSPQIASNESSLKTSAPARRGLLRRLAKDSRGANFVEYLVLIAVVALVGGTIFSGFVKGVGTAGTSAASKLTGMMK